MKYKKMVARLEMAKRWWENQSQSYKDSTTKPGSIKWK